MQVSIKLSVIYLTFLPDYCHKKGVLASLLVSDSKGVVLTFLIRLEFGVSSMIIVAEHVCPFFDPDISLSNLSLIVGLNSVIGVQFMLKDVSGESRSYTSGDDCKGAMSWLSSSQLSTGNNSRFRFVKNGDGSVLRKRRDLRGVVKADILILKKYKYYIETNLHEDKTEELI
ncbi:hypothetical protein AGLY_012828 [Aphis glycines]|uniref:Uncharacterized protein n=1 Tax=Aphis glycines TaxID=307491 RepID=A0A6G0T892_APHGL|nr:hypothetical protein AGLY_012828 [Aphis glycines]